RLCLKGNDGYFFSSTAINSSGSVIRNCSDVKLNIGQSFTINVSSGTTLINTKKESLNTLNLSGYTLTQSNTFNIGKKTIFSETPNISDLITNNSNLIINTDGTLSSNNANDLKGQKVKITNKVTKVYTEIKFK
ncbi:MAG: hypothetical protein PHE25_05910, partial [Candidatus Gracilibacteria bacterium]|nr:hypothetical protein [Candidatus Gracilibacteria bacterium]